MTSSQRPVQIPEFSKGDIVLWDDNIAFGDHVTGEVVEVEHLVPLDQYLYHVLWKGAEDRGPQSVVGTYLTPTHFPEGIAYCQVFVMNGKDIQFFGAFASRALAEQSADFTNIGFARIKEGEPMHGSYVSIIERKVPEGGIIPLYMEMIEKPSARDIPA